MKTFKELFLEGEALDYKETYTKWKSLVNLTPKELNAFLDTEEGKEAGLSRQEASELGISNGRDSARAIIRMKSKPFEDWNETDIQWMKKQISFISRMKGNKGKLYDDKGNKTPKLTSLLVWGHDPEKYAITQRG